MKLFFLRLLVIIAMLVMLFLAVPVFLPAHTHVERSIEINASPAEVYAVLADFHQYEHYDPWGSDDPTNQVTISGEGVGATYEWSGETAGRGRTTRTVMEPFKLIETEIEIYEPMEAMFDSDYQLEPSAGGTKVTWSYDQDLTYFSRYLGPAMDDMLGPDFERGLNSLKEYVESKEPDSQPRPSTETETPAASETEPAPEET